MSVISVLYNREFRRHRYVDGSGWIVSRDTFKSRVQPKFNDSIQRTRAPDGMDTFLNIIVYRDAPLPIAGFVTTSTTLPTPAEAIVAAQSGTELAVGDRLFEEDSTYALIVRGNSQFRDGFGIKHDEVVCSEASQLDQRWIEPILIGGTPDKTGETWDSLRHQFVRLTRTDLNMVQGFGIIEEAGQQSFDRDAKEITRTSVGKEITEKALVTMDSSFGITESNTLHFRGKDWKIVSIRETISYVMVIGVESYKQRGMSGDTPQDIPSRNISLS